ncbi:MAG: SusF/SusE family outer membrane protein, partial [Sphingobacteriales bacterium]
VVNSDAGAPTVTTPTEASTVTVTKDDMESKVLIRWNRADYGVSTVLNYIVQIDKAGNNFAAPVVLGNTPTDSLSITKAGLNNAVMNTLGLPENAESEVEIRIQTAFNKDTVTSKALKFKVMTYKDATPERLKLSVPGAYQGWAPPAAPVIYQIDGAKYEGYVYMATAGEFKFTSSPDWDHINYGSVSPGTLTTDGTKGGIVVGDPGYYKFNVDVNELTYSYTLVQSFGLIGTATTGQWDSSTPMTYNEGTGLWTVTTDLAAGALKFRANNGWDLNYGPAVTADLIGRLVQTNDAINITEAGNYTVTLDMRQTTPDSYTYKVVKN